MKMNENFEITVKEITASVKYDDEYKAWIIHSTKEDRNGSLVPATLYNYVKGSYWLALIHTTDAKAARRKARNLILSNKTCWK